MGTRANPQPAQNERAGLSYFDEPSMQVTDFKAVSLGTQKAKGNFGLLACPSVGATAGNQDEEPSPDERPLTIGQDQCPAEEGAE